jgi:hypothetical protein
LARILLARILAATKRVGSQVQSTINEAQTKNIPTKSKHEGSSFSSISRE